MGVYFDEKRNKFIARVTIDGKRTYLGQFDTLAEAEYVVLHSTTSKLAEQKVEFESGEINPNWIERLSQFFSVDKNLKAFQKRFKSNG